MKDFFDSLKLIYALPLLFLASCDLGNFDPINVFTQEPLAADAVALETAGNCGFTLLVNNDRIQQTGSSATVKGSLYASINGNATYLGSGEFELATDVEGRVTALEGFANTELFRPEYLDASVNEEAFFANIALSNGSLPSVFENETLPSDACYLFYRASEDTAMINSGSGVLKMQELYIDPLSGFMLYRGSLDLSALLAGTRWLAVDPARGFSFEAENSSEDFEFEAFSAQIYTENLFPLIVDSILLNSTGSIVIDGSYNNGGLRNFFNASSANVQLGINGETEVSYVFADRLLAGFDFYANVDKSVRAASFNIAPATFYFRRNGGDERFSFYGEVADVQAFNASLLAGHGALRVLESPSETSAVVAGNFAQAEANRNLRIQQALSLNLGEKGNYELRDAEIVINTDEITLGGIFVSAFATLPDIFISGNLNEDSSMNLSGQSLFAVNFDGTTLPVTFSVSVEVNGDEEILQISGLAEYCDQGNCNFLPVNITADFENELLQLCVDIPNRGEVCIQ